ncbi:MAG: alpha-galactosidase [Armatimonadota bacterium]|nr:alpha-galactosidase [Armatimonadota bacterium]
MKHAVVWLITLLVLTEASVSATSRKQKMPSFDPCNGPFSFVYGGKPIDSLLSSWKTERKSRKANGRKITTTVWRDPESGLRLTCELSEFSDFPAQDWVLWFENTGKTDTKMIENVQALDIKLNCPMNGHEPYRLHRTHGGTPDPMQFEPRIEAVDRKNPRLLDSGHGRSSAKDFPFFRIDTGKGAVIVAIGWSGFWKANLDCSDAQYLHVTAGMGKTHFILHPGEKVRSPRILFMDWQGDSGESNARFRQLIYKHYAAKLDDKTPLPTAFCNTCFTRGGGWLNECNAENQISLINAYAKLGVNVIMTDAGWFTGGWPNGAGNFDVRKDAYPEGMGPVAAAAKERGGIYGLWFEPERVIAGTATHKQHPDWCLAAKPGPQDTYLLNFGMPQVQEYLFNIVKGFMDLPGFRVYRQDFNMDPLPFWQYNDPPDRQGITEMKYIEGLYAFWDRLAKTWPDSFREECASGGNRLDLETVKRLHIAQKTDYWFHDDVDQAALWGLSQYLPNNTFVAHLNNLDEYSFHSTLASSLCLGWIADAPDFDAKRGKELVDRYKQVRHLLTGAWYPLLPYSRDPKDWIASQYHRPDLDEGMILAFRRAESPNRTVEVSLRGLDPKATYELSYGSGKTAKIMGEDLQRKLALILPAKRSSELILYRKVKP